MKKVQAKQAVKTMHRLKLLIMKRSLRKMIRLAILSKLQCGCFRFKWRSNVLLNALRLSGLKVTPTLLHRPDGYSGNMYYL